MSTVRQVDSRRGGNHNVKVTRTALEFLPGNGQQYTLLDCLIMFTNTHPPSFLVLIQLEFGP